MSFHHLVTSIGGHRRLLRNVPVLYPLIPTFISRTFREHLPSSGPTLQVWNSCAVCVSCSSRRVPSAHVQVPITNETPPPLTAEAKTPSPGTHQNLILQRGNHSNQEKHWGERREDY